MSLYPDRGPSSRKEEVIQRSSILRTFLNSTHQALNPVQWIHDLEASVEQVAGSMTSSLGADWQRLTAAPLVIAAGSFGLLYPGMPIDRKSFVIRAMVGIGFEIGDYKDINLVFVDCVERLGKNNYLNPECYSNPAKTDNALDFISTLLSTGTYLKMLTKLERTGSQKIQDNQNEPKDKIDDFLKGLNLEGI